MSFEIFSRWEERKKEINEVLNQIIILSTFTVNPIEPYLGIELMDINQPHRIAIGSYNQIIQQLTDEKSSVFNDKPSYIIVWPRIEDFIENQIMEGSKEVESFLKDAEVLSEAVLRVTAKVNKKIIFVMPAKFVNKPAGIGGLQIENGIELLSERFRITLMKNLCGQKNVLVCDAEEAIREISLQNALNPTMYALAKIPYTDLMFKKVVEQIKRAISMFVTSNKILLFDTAMLINEEYDVNDKWNCAATISEIGKDDSIRELQKYINMLAIWGTDIAFCTILDKKEFNDLMENQDIVLELNQAKHICYCCNDITEAVKMVADSAKVEPERVVFVTPRNYSNTDLKMCVLQLPEDRAHWVDTINRSEYIDHIPETNIKNKYIHKDNKGDFFSNLELKVDLCEVKKQQLNLVLHMMESIKDFRYTNTIWEIEELTRAYEDIDYKIIGIYVKDRFGDYGMSGLIVGKVESNVFHIVDLMLNCRILGKQVEYHVMIKLVGYALSLNCNQISMKFIENDRNILGGEFIAEILEKDIDRVRGGEEFVADCNDLAAHALTKTITCSEPKEPKVSASLNKSAAELIREKWKIKSIKMKNRIISYGTKISNADDIMNEINSAYRSINTSTSEYVPPRTETEKKLSDLWSEILHIEKVGVLDNFFGIGGTSILATQLIVKFKETFGVELPVRIFFDKSSIEQLASYIDALEINYDKDKLNEESIQNYRSNIKEYLRREIYLDESIKADGILPCKSAAESKTVFLTGVTGFLGAFLLEDIFKNTDYTVYCLVRTCDEESGMKRIEDNLSTYEIWNEEYAERIVIICGDFALPLLGLSNEKFMKMAEQVDMIYHCGADTNFLEPYHMLKLANVGGTQEILRLAATVRLKIVHFVSTHYVFSTISNPPESIKYEDEIPTCNEIVIMGYQQTKLISEQTVAIARERGIPVNIYRPGRISGSSETGACQTRDFVWLMIKCCVESGLMFEDETNIELIPVDYVARAIVQISKEPSAINRNFHIINRSRTPIDYITQWMDERGFKVSKYPYMEWKDRLTKKVATNEGLNSISAMLPFITEDAEVIDKSLILDTKNIDEVLENSGVVRKEVDKELFEKYLDYFIKIGFFNIAG